MKEDIPLPVDLPAVALKKGAVSGDHTHGAQRWQPACRTAYWLVGRPLAANPPGRQRWQ